jgi:hypothetical protein
MVKVNPNLVWILKLKFMAVSEKKGVSEKKMIEGDELL